MICKCCKKEKFFPNMFDDKFCKVCVEEIRSSFSYGIGGKEVSKQTHDRIVERGYVIPEELDKDRQ